MSHESDTRRQPSSSSPSPSSHQRRGPRPLCCMEAVIVYGLFENSSVSCVSPGLFSGARSFHVSASTRKRTVSLRSKKSSTPSSVFHTHASSAELLHLVSGVRCRKFEAHDLLEAVIEKHVRSRNEYIIEEIHSDPDAVLVVCHDPTLQNLSLERSKDY